MRSFECYVDLKATNWKAVKGSDRDHIMRKIYFETICMDVLKDKVQHLCQDGSLPLRDFRLGSSLIRNGRS